MIEFDVRNVYTLLHGNASQAVPASTCAERFSTRRSPLYVPRNYLLHKAIEDVQTHEKSTLRRLYDVLKRPFTPCNDQREHETMSAVAPEWAKRRGISQLSCSS